MSRVSQVPDWLARHRLEAGLTLRMSAAALITFALGHALGLAQVFWAVLTAIVVMQSSIGGSLKAMIDRIIGTIGGAFWGAAVTLAIPHGNVYSLGLALAVALVPLAAMAAFRPSFRVAPVTAAIVLIGFGGQGNVVYTAVERVFEIGLGSIVALVVAVYVSPTRANEMLAAAARDALTAMGEQARMLLGDIKVPPDPAAVLALHDRARSAIERATTAADECRRERRSHLSETPDPDPIVRNLRRLSHDLIMIGRALSAPLPETVTARLAEPAAAGAAALAAAFADISTALVTASAPPDPTPAKQALAGFEAAVAAMRSEGATRDLSEDAVERIFGLAFAIEQLGGHLDELTSRVREQAGSQSL